MLTIFGAPTAFYSTRPGDVQRTRPCHEILVGQRNGNHAMRVGPPAAVLACQAFSAISESRPEPGMRLEEITLALFATSNSLRILAYIPQLRKAATDENGASAISYTTWSLFLLAHLSTVAYALVNRADWWLALCFAGNALCCVAILTMTHLNRRGYAKRTAKPEPPQPHPPRKFAECRP